jgi:arylsulfatase A-like enzyme
VSLPVLNPATPLNVDFDSYELAPKHNDIDTLVSKLEFSDERPTFYLINAGETHYPYALPSETQSEWPHLHGFHGMLRHQTDRADRKPEAVPFFSNEQLRALRERQVRAAAYIDGVCERLLERVPQGTWLTITSDHGELFGEDGYFGHGPIAHRKLLEVPLIEGIRA